MMYLAMKMVTSCVLALCCLGTVMGTSMPFIPNRLGDSHTVYQLLNVQCSPMSIAMPRSHGYSGHGGNPPGYNSGNPPGYYQSISAPETCHLWVDTSGSCRVDWTHVIMEAHCRQVIGNIAYRSLSRDLPLLPPPPGQGESLPCGPSTSRQRQRPPRKDK